MARVRLLTGLLALLLAACGDRPPEVRPGPGGQAPPSHRTRPDAALVPARCPAGVAGCRAVTGRIVFTEPHDVDGDGDLHVIVAGGGISLPGLTSFDVSARLRPPRDPVIGDLATAAGPVQRGSYGQDQIHALEFRVRSRPRLHPSG